MAADVPPVVDSDVRPAERGFRAPGTSTMIAGGLYGAAAAYLFVLLGGRRLGTEAFAPVALLWTVFFIVATVVLVPLEQYVTREASRGRRILAADLPRLVTVAAGSGLIGGIGAYLARGPLFGGRAVFALQFALLMVGYASLFVGKGVLAGHRRFHLVGWLLAFEGTARLVAGYAFLAIAPGPAGLGWAMVAAPYAALLTRFWRFDRAADEGVPATSYRSFLGTYVAGSAASQLLLAGAPLGIRVLGGSDHLVSVVFATFTVYRAPLTLIYSLQGRLLPYLVRMAGDDEHGLRRMASLVVAGGVGLTVLGGAVGWLAGPQVVSLLMGDEFTPDRTVALLAAAGVVAASAAQIAGQVLVARGWTGRLASMWAVGLAAALVIVAIPMAQPDHAVGFAFAGGEMVALAMVAVLAVGRAVHPMGSARPPV